MDLPNKKVKKIKVCPNCGEENASNRLVCIKCGDRNLARVNATFPKAYKDSLNLEVANNSEQDVNKENNQDSELKTVNSQENTSNNASPQDVSLVSNSNQSHEASNDNSSINTNNSNKQQVVANEEVVTSSKSEVETKYVLVCPRCKVENSAIAKKCSCGMSLRGVTRSISAKSAKAEYQAKVQQQQQQEEQQRIAEQAAKDAEIIRITEVTLKDNLGRDLYTLKNNECIEVGREQVLNHFLQGHNCVSRRHAKISLQQNKLVIEDLESKNGTYINNQPIKPNTPTELKPRDEVTLGGQKLTYKNQEYEDKIFSFWVDF